MTRPAVIVVPDGEAGRVAKARAEELGVEVTSCASPHEVEQALATLASGDLRERLREASLVAAMSHDLRTPLNAIIGFSELLDEGVPGPLSAKQKDYVANVLASGRALLALLDDLVAVAKVDLGRLPLSCEPMPVEIVLEALAHLLGPVAMKHASTLRFDVPTGLPLVFVDAPRLKQALHHVVGAAIEATPAGAEVVVRAEPAPEGVVVTVTDAGPALDDAGRAAFFVVPPPYVTTAPASGTRLGLPLARRIILAHGGTIEVAPLAPRGNAVRVGLPAAR